MVPPPSTISRRARHSHRASVTDVPDEAEPVVQLPTPNTIPLDDLRNMARAAASLSHHRRSPSPILSRVGIEGASIPALTSTGTSITAHNANILRTVSTNANSLNPSVTQNNFQFIETLQMFNHSSNNTFNDTTFTSPARDYYSFHGPVTLTVHPDFINQVMLRTQPTGLRGLDSAHPVSFSGLQGPISLRPWVDADALERGDGLETPTIGMNRNSRLRRLINRDVFRAQDTNNLVIGFAHLADDMLTNEYLITASRTTVGAFFFLTLRTDAFKTSPVFVVYLESRSGM
ncbi:hypothetical protein K435DRAFT_362891 [Dendrothele bispora CBS 962.96]|uniref:Uncharacterized protein n=1 Tax=Dendrothele bispora (strain CBS 962.96) TaxID=1314807 RepID=A0A4S8LCQ7_DENBC|nr:hypothetical protein K435DRAFT_362891 [Dendrothele bispora CBS 962.96]